MASINGVAAFPRLDQVKMCPATLEWPDTTIATPRSPCSHIMAARNGSGYQPLSDPVAGDEALNVARGQPPLSDPAMYNLPSLWVSGPGARHAKLSYLVAACTHHVTRHSTTCIKCGQYWLRVTPILTLDAPTFRDRHRPARRSGKR